MTEAQKSAYLNTQFETPVLFLIFNRFDVTKLVFEQIKLVKPTKLYIACDGPRPDRVNEDKIVTEIRNWVIENITWNCAYYTLFRATNLGCGKAVSSAINWFFENVPEGIILEDDCLPSPDFFRFCAEMLKYYRDDDSVAHICGCNLQDGILRSENSYYFSNFTYVWGWAGWRRVWREYDFGLKRLDKVNKGTYLSNLTDSMISRLFLKYIFKNVKKGNIDTWDFQYLFLNVFNKKLSVVPNKNMISNIGFNKDATHTTSESINNSIPIQDLDFPISHPEQKHVNREADQYTLNKISPKPAQVILLAIKSCIKELLWNR